MENKENNTINVGKLNIKIKKYKTDDFLCLTDIAKYKNDSEPNAVISNWIRNFNTIEYLGLWEKLNNENFNDEQFNEYLNKSGSNSFTLSPLKWKSTTNAIGLFIKSGNGGGTFAHKDIALKFASWISPEFELYVAKDYQRLKENELSKNSSSWNLNREIAKINYKIHTNAIQTFLSKNLTEEQLSFKYASEADLLNVAIFGKTAKQWKDENKNLKGNIRDYADINSLLVLSNMENYNAILIEKGLNQNQRLIEIRSLAREQYITLEKINKKNVKKIEEKKNNIK